MKKPLILAVGGAIVGVAVAFAVFTFVIGGGASAATPEPEQVVSVPGKLGPHITLADRVFNLRSAGGSPAYLKLQTLIEFETTDSRWQHVLTGCGTSAPHGAALSSPSERYVSSMPFGAPSSVPAAGGPAVDPCVAEQAHLLEEFDRHIGTGRQLIEDAITTIVTAHTAEELSTTEGKAALRHEIQEAVEEIFHGDPPVTRVLFLNFITQ